MGSLSDVQKDVLRLPSIVTLPCIQDIRFAHRNGSPTTTIRDFTVFNDRNHRFPSKLTNMGMTTINGSFSTATDDGNHCVAVGYHRIPKCLHFFEIGGTTWKPLDSPLYEYVQVMGLTKKDKLFFALNTLGEIEAWDLSDLSNIKRTPVAEAHRLFSFDPDEKCHSVEETDLKGQTYRKKEIDYMVESFGDFLLITRYINSYHDIKYESRECYRTTGFAVRRLNFGLRKWETINSLSGCAIFLGVISECFSLHARDYSRLEENAIYFAPADDWSYCGGKAITKLIGIVNLLSIRCQLLLGLLHLHPFGLLLLLICLPPIDNG